MPFSLEVPKFEKKDLKTMKMTSAVNRSTQTFLKLISINFVDSQADKREKLFCLKFHKKNSWDKFACSCK